VRCTCPAHVEGEWIDDITAKCLAETPNVATPYRVDGEVQWLRCGELVIPVTAIGAAGSHAYKVLTMTKYPVTGVLYFLPSGGEVMQLVQELARV
jgi:hypothetical protein